MGWCNECVECGEKFKVYDEEDEDTCPSCLEKEARKKAELEELRSRIKALQKEVQDERSKRIAAERRVGAGSTSEAPVAKKQKTETAPPLPPAEAEVIDMCDEGDAGAGAPRNARFYKPCGSCGNLKHTRSQKCGGCQAITPKTINAKDYVVALPARTI